MNDMLNTYKSKKVLITGHTGFKGSWLSVWLKKLGAEVIGYSLEPPAEPNLFNAIALRHKIRSILGDVKDEMHLFSVFKKYKPEMVFHLAAQPLVGLSYKEAKLTYETNVMGTVNILEAVRKTQSVKVCINITTDKCYENKERIYGYKESDRLGGYDPYSSSKACAEVVTAAYRQSFFNPAEYNKSHHVGVASVRAGNIIGGGDWQEDRLIPDCIKALSRNTTIIIRNPRSIRPWQYILEPLAGYLLLGSLIYKKGAKYSGSWNFGPKYREHRTVEEIVELVVTCWGEGGYKVKRIKDFHETKLLKLNINKAITSLGWEPIYHIGEAVERTVSWYKEFYNSVSSKELYKLTIKEIAEYIAKKGVKIK